MKSLSEAFRSAGIKTRPPIPRAEVAAFEAGSRITFPPDYIAFITEVANGGSRPCGLVPLKDWSACYWIDNVTPASLAEPCIVSPEALHHGPAWLDHVGVDDWETKFNANQWDPMSGTIAIAEIGCGLFYSLVLNGPVKGRVFSYGDHIANPPRFVVEETFVEWMAACVDASLHGQAIHFLDGRIR
jgi:hypothetical protein